MVDGRSMLDLTSMGADDGFRIVSPTSRLVVNQISSIGDINGDGYDDIVVGVGGGVRGQSGVDGHAYVLFGKATGFGTVDLQDIKQADGFAIEPAPHSNEHPLHLGTDVGAAGDVNGDGLDDFIVAGIGATYVFYGSTDKFGDQVGGQESSIRRK